MNPTFFSDAHLGEAKFTGFLVGLSMYAGAPFARIRVDLDSNVRLKSTGPKGTQLFETSCRYEARLNPFANVNPHQVDIVLGENVVYHLADVLADHLIQAYGYRSKDIASNLKAGVDGPHRSQQAKAEESVGSSKTPWRQLRRGLSVEMTRRLLGAPHETSESRASTIWYYPDVDGGFVAFRGGLVVQWREPVTRATMPVEEIATATPATAQPKRKIEEPPTNAVSPETPKRSPKPKRKPQTRARKWYEGGTLKQKTMADWYAASYRNRLATSADFAMVSLKVLKHRKPRGMDELKKIATALEICISEAGDDPSLHSQQVSDMCAMCALVLETMDRHTAAALAPEETLPATSKPKPTARKWYEGGTLAHKTGADWLAASYRNRLASSGDYAIVYLQERKEKYPFATKQMTASDLSKIKRIAIALETCVSKAAAADPTPRSKSVDEMHARCCVYNNDIFDVFD